jgi:hypothetical protein
MVHMFAAGCPCGCRRQGSAGGARQGQGRPAIGCPTRAQGPRCRMGLLHGRVPMRWSSKRGRSPANQKDCSSNPRLHSQVRVALLPWYFSALRPLPCRPAAAASPASFLLVPACAPSNCPVPGGWIMAHPTFEPALPRSTCARPRPCPAVSSTVHRQPAPNRVVRHTARRRRLQGL